MLLETLRSSHLYKHPTLSVVEDEAYSYQVTTQDVDVGDSVNLTISPLPNWLTFNSGILSGTPANSDIGTYTVTITAEDTNSISTTQSFDIEVSLAIF